MSRLARSRRSTSKQRGAEMSSRLMPAKTGAISSTVADDLVDVLGVEADREGVDAGEPLEQRGLALHHRQRGDRPEVAQPEHRGAVGDHGDGVALDGQPAGVARGSRRWPGRPGRHPACRSSTGRRGCGSGPSAGSRSCRRGASGRCGRRPCRSSRRRPAPAPRSSRSACSVSLAAQVTSIRSRSCPDAVTSRAVTMPPACSTACGQLADRVAAGRDLEPHGDRVRDARHGSTMAAIVADRP